MPRARRTSLPRTSAAPRSSHMRRGGERSQRSRLASSSKRSTIWYWSPPAGGCSAGTQEAGKARRQDLALPHPGQEIAVALGLDVTGDEQSDGADKAERGMRDS